MEREKEGKKETWRGRRKARRDGDGKGRRGVVGRVSGEEVEKQCRDGEEIGEKE